MICGGLGQKLEKNSTATRLGKTVGWPGKKTKREFSARRPPPDH